MFQTFDTATNPAQGPERLAALRAWMGTVGVDGFLVPRADKFQGEYVAHCDDRLAWLTGFTGSAGFACVLQGTAGVFIDGRYRIQVRAQVADCFTPVHWPETGLMDWLAETAHPPLTIGFDPWLHTQADIDGFQSHPKNQGRITFKPVENGIDTIWHDRPAPPMGAAFAHPSQYAGETAHSKIARIAQAVADQGHDACLLTLPDSVNWLLNIRGSDIARTPIVQAFALVTAAGHVTVISDPAKFQGLDPDPLVKVVGWDDITPTLAAINGPVGYDPKQAPVAAVQALTNGVAMDDPTALPKACKNAVEVEGARQAHLRDGAAFCEFLAWFNTQPHAEMTEIDVVTALEGFRTQTGALHDISFETISGSGPNGAIVHYRVTDDSNRKLDHNSLLLIDSGGQYRDGTTDITRTLPLGTPTDDMRQCFTRVLQGMIAISKLRFPRGYAGRDIDALARAPLWGDGLDYDHGTGHGVGSFLSVHEGPARISRTSHVPLADGMILSNEPGYYREGAFGIRIENLIVVTPAPALDGGDTRDHLCFETLTMVPIDTRLIDHNLLTASERAWLNAYHAQVRDCIAPRLSPGAQAWLNAATVAI